MATRGRGQLAVVSSLAGFRGLASSPAYSASKAAVRVYGEAMRGFAARYGVEVSVVCPGFVRSRLTATNQFPMPLLMDSDKAARIIAKGLERNRGRIAFPWPPPCDGAPARVVAEGWVPARAADGRLAVWFFSRGC